MTKKELQKIIGQNLLQARTRLGLTQEDLADKVEISTTFYANLECGNRMMSIVTLRKLAYALCVSTDSLLFDNRPNERTHSIQMMLQNQPTQVVSLSEKIIRVCIDELSTVDTKKEGTDRSDASGAQTENRGIIYANV